MRSCLIIYCALLFVNLSLQAHPGWGIVVDKDRNIYFPDIMRNGGTIFKLSKEGKISIMLKGIHAHNVVLDDDGNLITAHGEDNHTMLRINTDGSIDTLIHTHDMDVFFGGNSTWSKHHGIIYGLKKDKKLMAIDADGNRSPVSDFEFAWNQVIYADPDGIIYAPDIAYDNGVLVRIDTTGKGEIIARDLISKLDRPKDRHNDVLLGITKGCDGDIYLAELAGQHIIKILDDGQHETFYKSENSWFPCAIDFFSGDAYIMEYRHSREGMKGPQFVKIDESGNKSILFSYDPLISEMTLPQVKKKSFWFPLVDPTILLLLFIAFAIGFIAFVQLKTK